jgi:hypothetical protein
MDKRFVHCSGFDLGLWSTHDQSINDGETNPREKRAELEDSRPVSPCGPAEMARRECPLVTRVAPGRTTPASRRWARLRLSHAEVEIAENPRVRSLAAEGESV